MTASRFAKSTRPGLPHRERVSGFEPATPRIHHRRRHVDPSGVERPTGKGVSLPAGVTSAADQRSAVETSRRVAGAVTQGFADLVRPVAPRQQRRSVAPSVTNPEKPQLPSSFAGSGNAKQSHKKTPQEFLRRCLHFACRISLDKYCLRRSKSVGFVAVHLAFRECPDGGGYLTEVALEITKDLDLLFVKPSRQRNRREDHPELAFF